MSGQQIGTVVGGIAGFAIGGPAGAQIGMAVGGLIGGIVDPTKVNGPKIGDGQTQQATDGIAIAWVQGTARIAGTLVQYGPRRQHKVKDSGKGGTSVHHYEAHQDFAILVCESCSLRDSVMSSIVMVEQDGHIVYDVRPGSTILSDSAKWKANVDFMYGDEAQMPHPTLEAITGVGNQVAYRGRLVAVFRDFNLTTKSSNRIPSFVFTVKAAPANVAYTDYWKYRPTTDAEYDLDFSSSEIDDSSWAYGPGGFGDFDPPGCVIGSAVTGGVKQSVWLRRNVPPSATEPTVTLIHNDAVYVYLNGELVYSNTGPNTGSIPDVVSLPINQGGLLAVKVVDAYPSGAVGMFAGVGIVYDDVFVSLEQVVSRICLRGGLERQDFNAGALSAINVTGYPLARQSSGTDALTPLLAAYFAYATEYDAKLYCKFYGGNALVTIEPEDLLAGNDANNGYITKNLRNQQTEFPRRVVASYYDPAQNYFTCQVAASRVAVGVKSIGDQAFDIPVVMDATTAQQAADKALKVAYATLEGTIEDSVPFATSSAIYLSLAAGDAVIFKGKRYVLDAVVLSQNYIKLTKRYDRQDAYTSVVQSIPGNAPAPPTSSYSGASTLYVLNLPSLRSQDTYGVYLAAASLLSAPSTSWQGCNAQMSLDGQATWNTVASISQPSVMGTMAANEPSAVPPEPLTVQVNGDLETVTPTQLAAQANAFAVVDAAGVAEVGQFETATEQTSVNEYQLTNVYRGLKGTTQAPRIAGEVFTMLDAVYFVAIDPSLAGKTIYFRTIGYGESTVDPTIVALVYNPDTDVIINGGQTGT